MYQIGDRGSADRGFVYSGEMTRPFALIVVCMIAIARPPAAFADITAFLGVNPTPASRPVKGFAGGVGLLIVGFEFEYASTSEDLKESAPRLRTYMGNGLVQTPFAIGGMQLYATAGGGVYRETLADVSETHVGINVGGGVKMSLVGPLRLRLDYRVFTLRGQPRHSKPQRFYAGLNLKF
jgi:hypothetical protein